MACSHEFIRSKNRGVCVLCAPKTFAKAVPDPHKGSKVVQARLLKKRREIQAGMSLLRLSSFVEFSWDVLEPGTKFEDNWHIRAICDHIQRVLEGWLGRESSVLGNPKVTIQNLCINVPPGSLKSRILSVCAPAWMWLHDPGWRVICLSSNPTVAVRDARYCRELITSDWYRKSFEVTWKLKPDQDAITDFANTHGGSRNAQGLNAKITGQRADALFVDDPHDAYEALSDTKRKAVVDRWRTSANNRVNDAQKSIRIGIMQRLHEGDWAGHVIEQGWESLVLPMEYDPKRGCSTVFGWSDPRASEGELLHEARYPEAVLVEERKNLGSYGYAGQMQQLPAPNEGGLFMRKWWGFWKPEGTQGGKHPRPDKCSKAEAVTINPDQLAWQLISLDCNFKKTESGSRVCMLVIGGKGSDRYVLDNITEPMGFTETVAKFEALCTKWPKATKKLIEDKANGSAVIDVLRGKIGGIVPIEPKGGKEARASAIQPFVQAGDVYLPDGAYWLDTFVGELGAFPNGRHDDQVDSLSQGLIDMMQGSSVARLLGGATL